jgi:polyisoprenoid-binding protein YceI
MKLAYFAAAALAPALALASATNFAGTWKLDNTFNGKIAVIHCTLVQEGDTLSGSCVPDLPGMAASKLTGTLKGSTAKWGYDLEFNGKPARVDYEVTLTADGSLSGSVFRNGRPSAITGMRQP